MQARFLLGPAGSGKTHHCLEQIRGRMAAEPDGAPLILLAPKQTTYEMERRLLSTTDLQGYTRLQILSFERLAYFLLGKLGLPEPRILNEEGRLMVLRGIVGTQQEELRIFRASARLAGFAKHLSEALRELQRHQLKPADLLELSEKTSAIPPLSDKLHDLAVIFEKYIAWQQKRSLLDPYQLLNHVSAALKPSDRGLRFDEIWIDGFTEFSPQELEFLQALLPFCAGATITFCLDRIPTEEISWLSNWSMMRRSYQNCRERIAELPGMEVKTELLGREAGKGRFAASPVLARLEESWAKTEKAEEPGSSVAKAGEVIRIIVCATPGEEAVMAAREIRKHVSRGGRYRDVAVLGRSLEPYHPDLVKTFGGYEIPFFMDQREPVSHHPLAELTRNSLRTVWRHWQIEDWFAALKTGFAECSDEDIDRLENEAMAHGWRGDAWDKPIVLEERSEQAARLEELRKKILPPFKALERDIAFARGDLNGMELAGALRKLWDALGVMKTLQRWSENEDRPQPLHATVWEQMNAWLENIELAFPEERMDLGAWLPILDAGLSGLTVGVIPPALDQVLIGAIDRSRNPDIRLAIVLGMNEGLFPAPPKESAIITEADREALAKHEISLSGGAKASIGRERYFGYLAMSRAKERLVLSRSRTDAGGNPLNASPFLAEVRRIFPELEEEIFRGRIDWKESVHSNELVAPLLRLQMGAPAEGEKDAGGLLEIGAVKALRERLEHFAEATSEDRLDQRLVEGLYGKTLNTSVSRLEQFAACPFKFLVHSGFRAEERQAFEADSRALGNFQHEILQNFHEQLMKEGLRWRDVKPEDARDRVLDLCAATAVKFQEGVLQATEQSKFAAKTLMDSLSDFVEILVTWMNGQYAFDPRAVEVAFGGDGGFPGWSLDLGEGHRLVLNGRIDRIDLCLIEGDDAALCVVVDYKSSQKKLEALYLEHGLQLQLASYLGVLRHWKEPKGLFGVSRLIPAGIFYVNLSGKYEYSETRGDALGDLDYARKRAYQHTGRFDESILAKLDQRRDAMAGDQFRYRRKKDLALAKKPAEWLDSASFLSMLDGVENKLKEMGARIYAGEVKVDPYRHGTRTACDLCDYSAVCRIDRWNHAFRVLKSGAKAGFGDV